MGLGAAIPFIKGLAPKPIDPADVSEAVAAYLEEHPEATCPIDDTAGEGDTGKVWSADKTAGEVASLTEAIENIEDDLSDFYEKEIVANPVGWRLNESDGLCSSDSGYQLQKFTVTAGQKVKVVSDDRFQFQNSASVPSYGSSNRVGDTTYGTGTFVLTVPNTATYLIISTPTTGSTAKAYDTGDRLDGMETRLETVEAEASEIGAITNGEVYDLALNNVSDLNFASDATAYASANYYTTKYVKVSALRRYHFKVTNTSSGSISARVVFSESAPSNGVSGTMINDLSVSASGLYSFDYIPKKDGYIGMTAWYESTYTVSAEGIDMHGIQSKNTMLKMYCEEESLIQDSGAVSMDSWTTVPHNSAKVKVSCPDNVVVWFTYMDRPYTRSTKTSAYFGNGDVIALEKDYDLYKAHFAYGSKSNGAYTLSENTLSVHDVVEMIFNGKIQLLYEDETAIVNNKDAEKNVWAIIGDGTNPVLSHISDTHGDAVRYMNFMELSRYFNVLAAINTGDVVNEYRSDGCGYIKTAIREYPEIDQIFCMGNHDVPTTNALSYQIYYKMFNDAYGYGLSTNGTYYYKDYADKNLRIIVLNIYEEKAIGYSCCISQSQIEWFIDTLEDTPAGYGVIVVAHCPEKWVPKNDTYGKFWTKDATSTWGNTFPNITGNPISTIIDAFIGKTSISGSYTNTRYSTGTTEETVTISYEADFTSLATGAEFICYINGHKHCDLVGYLDDTTHPQLNLNIANGVASHYYRSENDLPRADGKGNVQDTINLYVIDRSNKSVKIARVGATVTKDMAVRDYMIIPYAT